MGADFLGDEPRQRPGDFEDIRTLKFGFGRVFFFCYHISFTEILRSSLSYH